MKSVKELHKFDHEGVEICRTLALKYATQLWEMVEAHKDSSSATPTFHRMSSAR